MSQPIVDVDAVSQGNLGVLMVMRSAQRTLGDPIMAFFLDLVPERGVELWERFRAFQGGREDVTFSDFINSVVRESSLKLFFPRECLLDELIQRALLERLQEALERSGASSNEEIFQIYSGEGPVYEEFRQVSCKGCHMGPCRHSLGSRVGPRR